jgi:SAM-dependent methyltransferase
VTTALEDASLLYRRPALYDQLAAHGDYPLATRCAELVDQLAPGARTLLELGCGTGRDLDHLAERFDCVGVDLGPTMVAHAHTTRPHLDIRHGDMRTFRLGRRVDVVACVGNALAYLHHDRDIAAAFTTFAVHAAPGGLLMIQTLGAPIEGPPATSRVDAGELHAEVTVSYDWDPTRRLTTMRRHWRHDDGTEDQDTIVRRLLEPHELEAHASRAGFKPRRVPGTEAGWLTATFPCRTHASPPGRPTL